MNTVSKCHKDFNLHPQNLKPIFSKLETHCYYWILDESLNLRLLLH